MDEEILFPHTVLDKLDLLKTVYVLFENGVDPDQLSSSESTLFLYNICVSS